MLGDLAPSGNLFGWVGWVCFLFVYLFFSGGRSFPLLTDKEWGFIKVYIIVTSIGAYSGLLTGGKHC